MGFLTYLDLTVAAISAADPFFLIPSGYVEPSEYPLTINTDQYLTPLLQDIETTETALYGSIVPLLQENICGYSLARPAGSSTLQNRSTFTYDLLRTARRLLDEINRAKACIKDGKFYVAVNIPENFDDVEKICDH